MGSGQSCDYKWVTAKPVVCPEGTDCPPSTFKGACTNTSTRCPGPHSECWCTQCSDSSPSCCSSNQHNSFCYTYDSDTDTTQYYMCQSND